jgi:hypothetical protein
MKYLTILAVIILSQASNAQNTLSKKEKRKGWQLLFDGSSTAGWHSYGKTTVGSSWKVADGAMYLDTTSRNDWQVKDGGDLVSNQSYDNYEFMVDWKISKNGNSGIIFNAKEDPSLAYVWQSGPEFQIADTGHPDAKIHKHAAGDLYDLLPASQKVANFDGWNTAKIINNRGLLQLYLNGVKLVETRIDTDTWKNLIAGSKFKTMPHFGKYLGGHIALQDHGNAVYFRNIKIRKL